MPNRRHLACITAFTILAAAALPVSAKVVGEPALAAACAKQAATILGTSLTRVTTLPTELTKGSYFVYGQVDREGNSAAMIECQFNSKKQFSTIKIDGKTYKVASSAATAPAVDSAPKAALAACQKQMAGPTVVEKVSQLRPGFHEIILKEKNTGRRVACTASDKGSIEDWVEMN